MVLSSTFNALGNEAGLAASHLMAGVTALGRANYANKASYYQAFFSLSVGIERTCKLILVCDHALENGGTFPAEKMVRAYGHDLVQLVSKVEPIGVKRKARYGRPSTQIHREVLRILSTFAANGTRYYNIDHVLGKPTKDRDPIADWYVNVVLACWEAHVPQRAKQLVSENARLVAYFLDQHAFIMHSTEEGGDLTDAYEASLRTGVWSRSAPYSRLVVLQWCRYLGGVIGQFSYLGADFPVFSDFYAKFNNDDQYLKSRKTWSLQGR